MPKKTAKKTYPKTVYCIRDEEDTPITFDSTKEISEAMCFDDNDMKRVAVYELKGFVSVETQVFVKPVK